MLEESLFTGRGVGRVEGRARPDQDGHLSTVAGQDTAHIVTDAGTKLAEQFAYNRGIDHRISEIFDAAPIGIGVVDLDGHVVMSNQLLRRLLGYSEAEFKRLRWQDYTHPDDLAPNAHLFCRLTSGEIDHFEMEKRWASRTCSTENTPW